MGRILLGVTGGIAAYKAVELARLAVKAGHAVRVIQTEASTRFVGTATFAAVTGAPVLISEWERDPARGGGGAAPAPPPPVEGGSPPAPTGPRARAPRQSLRARTKSPAPSGGRSRGRPIRGPSRSRRP